MKICDLLSNQTFRKEYIEHLRAVETSNEIFSRMNGYFESGEFKEDVSLLQDGTYYFSAPDKKKMFMWRKEKTRSIWIFPERQVNFQRIVCYALHKYDGRFSKRIQYGLKKTVHWETVLRRLENYDKLYYFSTDIHKCSNSINRDILLGKLDDFIDDDPVLLKYLKDFVQCRQYVQDGIKYNNRCAVPAGSPLSCFLINLYLRELDQSIETEADFYSRLTDRIVIGCFDLQKLRKLAKKALEVLSCLKLTVNEDETFFLNSGESLIFMGKRVSGREIDFSSENLTYIERYFRVRSTLAKRAMHGLKPRTRAVMCIYELETNPIYSYLKKSFPNVNTDKSYKKLDCYIQNLLREIITGKSGSKKYLCTYKNLQSYGYSSLTGQYYKFIKHKRCSKPRLEK